MSADKASTTRPFKPVRAGTLVGLASLTGVLIAFCTLSAVSGPVPRWAGIAERQRTGAPLLLVIFGLAGAVAGSLVHRVSVGPTAHRGYREMMTHHVGRLSAAGSLGVCFGILPAIEVGQQRVRWGTPNLLEVLASALIVTAGATVGYAIGAQFRSKWAIPGGVAAAFMIYLFPIALSDAFPSTSFYSIAPDFGGGGFEVPPGWKDAELGGAFRIGFFGLLIWAVVIVANASNGRLKRATAILVFGLFCILAVLRQPPIIERVNEVECFSIEQGSVCVPADTARIGPEISRGVDSVTRRFGLGALQSNVIDQESGYLNFYYEGRRAEFLAAQQVAQAMLGSAVCSRQLQLPGAAVDQLQERSIEIGDVVGVLLYRAVPEASTTGWISFQTDPVEFSTLAARFNALSDAMIREFFDENETALRQCDLGLSLSEMLDKYESS